MEQVNSNIVVIDTTTQYLKIGLSIDNEDVILDINNGYKHVENLIPHIDKIFSDAGQKPAMLDFIGVCAGPGSFTGIRIGIATALGLSFAGNIKCFGFSVFDVYQYLLRDKTNALIIPVLDAKKKRFFCAFIDTQNQDKIIIHDIEPDEIIVKIKQLLNKSDKKIIFAGSDFKLIENNIKKHFPFDFLFENDYLAKNLLEYSKYHIINKELIEPEPIYLRKSEAEIALLSKEKIEKS